MSSTSWLDLIAESEQNGGAVSYGPIPAGEYRFKVLEAEKRETAQQKTKYTIKAEVQDGPHGGRLVWDDLIVSPESPKAMGFFFSKMKALGLGKEFFSTQPSDDQIVSALKDSFFVGKVIIDTWGGKERNKIDGYKPAAQAQAQGFIPPAPQAAAQPQQYAAPQPPQQFAAPQPQQQAPQQAQPQQAPWQQGAPQQAVVQPQQAVPQGGPGPWDNTPQQAAPAPGGAPQFPKTPF